MFLVLSKMLDLGVAPLTWAIVLAVLGLVFWRRGRLGIALALLGVLELTFFSCEKVAAMLARWTEAPAVRTFDPKARYDAIIVLGGVLDTGATERVGELVMTEAPDRIVRTVAVLKADQARVVLISGGLLTPHGGMPSEAERLAGYLLQEGISPDRIVVEGRSRNTHENAVESARFVKERGWKKLLLVTSAWHMPRSLGCFHALGLYPDTLPVDQRAINGPDARWLPRAHALSLSTDMLRELVGRMVYRVVGYAK